MKKILMNMLFLGVCCLFLACQENDRLMFDEPASIYFYESQWGGDFPVVSRTDSTEFSFFGRGDNFTEAKAELIMLVTGYVSDKDRAINLVPDAESTLIEGEDYYFPAPKVLPAGATEVRLPVMFKRTEKLINDYYWVRFHIEDSDDLKKGYADRTSFKFRITNKPVKPTYYLSVVFGEYSDEKLLYIYSVVGYINWETVSTSELKEYSIRVRKAYEQYKKDNGPLYDSVGKEITFPGY